jgi:hypothetical protein
MYEPELAALANEAGQHYQRYLNSRAEADFVQAVTMQNEAVARGRAIGFPALPHLLYDLAILHHARFILTSDRSSLSEAVCLMHEANVLAPGDTEILDWFNNLHHKLVQLIDPDRQAEVEWRVAIYQRMLREGHRDRAEVWVNLACALRNLAAHTRSTDDLRALVEACDRAISLTPPAAAILNSHRDYAASALVHLAALDRDADKARRAGRYSQWLAERDIPGEHIYDSQSLRATLAYVLAYELSGANSDRDTAIVALAMTMESSSPESLSRRAQDVVASLLSTGDTTAREMAAYFATWCVKHLDDSESGSWDPELPALLNTLGACLPEGNPVPWPGWPEVGSLARKQMIPGLADTMAGEHPFHVERRIMGPTGKIYLDSDIPLLAAEWEPTADCPLRGHAITRFRNALVLPPGTSGNTEPAFIPAELHTVIITVAAPDDQDAQITEIRADVKTRTSRQRFPVDSIMCSTPPPNPGTNIFLDFEPPLFWPSPATLAVPAGDKRTLVVRAVTEAHEVHWQLRLYWRCDRRHGTFLIPLHTTGENGFRTLAGAIEVVRAPGNTRPTLNSNRDR